MKIIILGAGQVGSSVAAALASEANDITVVDRDSTRLRELEERLDLQTVLGHAAHPDVLERAGAEDADMILAVTSSDETNMVACQVAYTLFRTPTKIARIRARSYLAHQELFSQEALPVDRLISPEQVLIEYVRRLIEYPGALQVLDFAGGKVQLVAVRAEQGGFLVGRRLKELRSHMPEEVDTRVAAIFGREGPTIPTGETIIQAGDEVFFIAAREHIRTVMAELRRMEKPVKRIIIAGGGNVGRGLAKALEERYQVKLIDHNVGRSKLIAEELTRTIVLLGDAADEELLREENIENTDVFCAVTNDDEANILSAMLAKRLGAKRVIALINRAAYVDLVESSQIDVAISPQHATIGSLLSLVRRGDVSVVHSLRRGAAEAVEIVAHGDPGTSKVVGRAVGELKLPPGTTIGALVRGEQVLIAHSNTVIQPEDHVILFLVDKRRVPEVERLFQVSATYL